MGKRDVITKDYLSDVQRFAQIYNNGMFEGQKIINPEKLRDLNPEEWMILTEEKSNRRMWERLRTIDQHRDVLKIYDNQAFLVICGLENQSEIHYAMPLRHMLYDALEYESQREAIEKEHRKKKDLRGAEFLSGFSHKDRLIPVITMTVYWGNEAWDGPRTLQEMLEIPPELESCRDKIGDYEMNLLEVGKIPNLELYEGELKALLGFVKYQKDKHALKNFMDQNETLFEEMSLETARAVSVLANIRNLEKSVELRSRQGEESVNMCQALEEMIEDGRLEGRLEGRMEGRMEGGIRTLIEDNLEEGIPQERIAEKLQKRFGLKQEDAWSAIQACKEQLGK